MHVPDELRMQQRHSESCVRQNLLACSMGGHRARAGHAGTAVGIATAFGAPIGGLLFAFEELASSFSQALGWQIFFACMLAVLTLDTAKSAQHALRRGHFGLFDGDASTVFFEARRATFPSAVPAPACASTPDEGGLLALQAVRGCLQHGAVRSSKAVV